MRNCKKKRQIRFNLFSSKLDMNILPLIGRNSEFFTDDLQLHQVELEKIVSSSSFLVIGGAGSIGQAVTKEIFK